MDRLAELTSMPMISEFICEFKSEKGGQRQLKVQVNLRVRHQQTLMAWHSLGTVHCGKDAWGNSTFSS